jgi:hypothetical protein
MRQDTLDGRSVHGKILRHQNEAQEIEDIYIYIYIYMAQARFEEVITLWEKRTPSGCNMLPPPKAQSICTLCLESGCIQHSEFPNPNGDVMNSIHQLSFFIWSETEFKET